MATKTKWVVEEIRYLTGDKAAFLKRLNEELAKYPDDCIVDVECSEEYGNTHAFIEVSYNRPYTEQEMADDARIQAQIKESRRKQYEALKKEFKE